MGSTLLSWIDLSANPTEAGKGIVSMIRILARRGRLRHLGLDAHYVGARPTEHIFPEIELVETERLDELCTAVETAAVRGFLDTPWVYFSVLFSAPGRAGTGDGWVSGSLSSAFDIATEPFWGKDPPPRREVLRTLPPQLVEKAHPFRLRPVDRGGSPSFGSPEEKALAEGIWADIIHEVKPLRFVEGTDLVEWRDEPGFAHYYRDPMDMARTLKLVCELRAPTKAIAEVLVSKEFQSELPNWRKAPGPTTDGSVPTEGIFLRWAWHRESFEAEERLDVNRWYNLDGSPNPGEVLRSILVSRGFIEDVERTARKKVPFDAPAPAEG